MKTILLALSLLLGSLANAQTKTETTEFLKFVCYEGQELESTYTLMRTLGKDVKTGALKFVSQSVKVDDCATLPETDANHCVKLGGTNYHTWSLDQYVEGFASVYVIAGTSFSDALADSPATELFTQLIVTVSDPDETAQFYSVLQNFNPSVEQLNVQTNILKDCRVISYK